MSNEALVDAVHAYITTAYSAMGREFQLDQDFAFGVCLHWADAGRIMALKQWCKQMGFVDDEIVDDARKERLQFHIYKADGSITPITQGEICQAG